MSTDARFARPTPFARLLRAHAVMVCGDAAFTVSLAGSIFFQSPTHAARGKLLLFLLITMAPFAIVAPILGPALDRMKGGRRLLILLSAAGRGVLCVFAAIYISKPAPGGLLVYPLAFGVLVLAKGYQVAKSALLPALVTSDEELVNANSRLALIALIGASVGAAPAVVVQYLFGADWSLRFAAVVFAVGALFAAKIPQTRLTEEHDRRQEQLERAELHLPSILLAGSAMTVLRASVGFLLFFTAFAFKNDLLALLVIGVASGLGGFIGVIAAPVLRKSFREEIIVASALVLPAVCALLGALAGGAPGFGLCAMAVAIGAAGGRLGFDSLLQRDGPDAMRGRAFARFETRFQFVWVIGGLLGIIPFAKQLGLFLLGCVLAFAAVSYVGALRAARSRVQRTKLLPEAVDRAIVRSRERAMGEMRSRIRRKPKGRGDGAASGTVQPDDPLPGT
jgi:hypothetical protein